MNKPTFRSKKRSPFWPRVEMLEDRAVPASLLVTNLNNDGDGSLRAAIALANADPNPDLIRFARRLRGTIHLEETLRISQDVTIKGPGVRRITLSGEGEFRVLRIDDGTLDTIDVAIQDLTITNGLATDNVLNPRPDEGLQDRETNVTGGGGLLNVGENVRLSRMRFTNNQAYGGEGIGTFGLDAVGGAIANLFEGTMTVTASTFVGNKAVSDFQVALGNGVFQTPDGLGGAIGNAARSTLTVIDSVFLQNEGSSPTGSGEGGAVANENGSSLTIRGSRFQNNLAQGGDNITGFGGSGGAAAGGAIFNTDVPLYDNLNPTPANLQVVSSLFDGNEAIGGNGSLQALGSLSGNAFGGAIGNVEGASIEIRHTRFVNNHASSGLGSNGGGVVGGAVANVIGDAVVHSSSFGSNTVKAGDGDPDGDGVGTGFGGAGIGGAVANLTGTMNVTSSRFLFNVARAGDGVLGFGSTGGAVANNFGGQVVIANSTILMNQAIGGDGIIGSDARGGGILNGGSAFNVFTGAETAPPTMELTGSVVIGNKAIGGEGSETGGQGLGGGVHLATGGIATRVSTLILGNFASDEDDNVFGEFEI